MVLMTEKLLLHNPENKKYLQFPFQTSSKKLKYLLFHFPANLLSILETENQSFIFLTICFFDLKPKETSIAAEVFYDFKPSNF